MPAWPETFIKKFQFKIYFGVCNQFFFFREGGGEVRMIFFQYLRAEAVRTIAA